MTTRRGEARKRVSNLRRFSIFLAIAPHAEVPYCSFPLHSRGHGSWGRGHEELNKASGDGARLHRGGSPVFRALVFGQLIAARVARR